MSAPCACALALALLSVSSASPPPPPPRYLATLATGLSAAQLQPVQHMYLNDGQCSATVDSDAVPCLSAPALALWVQLEDDSIADIRPARSLREVTVYRHHGCRGFAPLLMRVACNQTAAPAPRPRRTAAAPLRLPLAKTHFDHGYDLY